MKQFFIVAILAVMGLPSWAHYNEVRDEAGRIRPEYAPIANYIDTAKASELKRFERESLEAFDGDNSLDPIPRILNDKEYNFLKRGVDQRARALLAFLKDHYSGEKKYLRDGIIPEAVVKRAMVRAGELGFEGLINPDNLAFHYGPDIVRGELNGQVSWYVLEDNTGYVGGLGDLILSQELILDLHPQLTEQFKLNNPIHFYQRLARHLRRTAMANGGIAVLFRSAGASDNEGLRVEKLMSTFGLEVVSPETNSKIIVEDGTVYLIDRNQKNSPRRKVGSILMEDELSWVDRTHPASAEKHILDIAKLFLDPGVADVESQNQVRELLAKINPRTGRPSLAKLKQVMREVQFLTSERSPVPGLVAAALAGQVSISNSPGTDFVSDKEIYLYLPKLIRYFLKERPILQNVPSYTFLTEQGTENKALINKVMDDLTDFVVKRFDGRGGGAVWIGSKLKPSEARTLRKEIEADPSAYKAQQRLDISQMEGDIVDLRILSHVSPNGILIADAPWGRGAPASGSGKVNISSKGHVVTVLVGEKKRRCEKLLKP